MQDDVKFCPVCGQAAGEAQPQQAQFEPQYQQQPEPQYQPPPQQYQQPPQQYQQQPPPQYQQPPQQYAQQPYEQQGNPQGQGYVPPIVPGAPGFDYIRDAQENKTMAILSYILFFVPLLMGEHKKSPFVKFHVNQGTILWIVSIGYSIISSILRAVIKVQGRTIYGIVTYSYTPVWLSTILWLISIPLLVLCIMGIINAVNGKTQQLPVIGKYVIIK